MSSPETSSLEHKLSVGIKVVRCSTAIRFSRVIVHDGVCGTFPAKTIKHHLKHFGCRSSPFVIELPRSNCGVLTASTPEPLQIFLKFMIRKMVSGAISVCVFAHLDVRAQIRKVALRSKIRDSRSVGPSSRRPSDR